MVDVEWSKRRTDKLDISLPFQMLEVSYNKQKFVHPVIQEKLYCTQSSSCVIN
jgi:hypothetical protein